MSDSAPPDPAAQAAMAKAMAAALRAFNTELWTLYSFGVFVTCLRTYARISHVGIANLRADDYIVWLAVLLYTTQSTLAFFAVNHGEGMANNGMTDAQRAALDPSSVEYDLRVFGSKIQIAGWTSYVCLIATLKMAVLVFYVRLTEGLDRRYRMRIWAGFALVAATFVASILTIYSACTPISRYWQINPDPGNFCQGAVARPIVWVTFTSSVVTDIYLIMIPIPMLWGTSLKMIKKVASTIVLGAGVFVLVCSLLKTIFVETDPVNGAQLAGQWGVRECFVSVVTTNLPMIFPLLRTWFRPLFGTMLSSSNQTPYKHPSGFRTIGGGDGGEYSSASASRRRGPAVSAKHNVSGNLSFSESEERIVNEIKMQNLNVYVAPVAGHGDSKPAKGIVVSNEFQITEDRTSQAGGEPRAQRVHESW